MQIVPIVVRADFSDDLEGYTAWILACVVAVRFDSREEAIAHLKQEARSLLEILRSVMQIPQGLVNLPKPIRIYIENKGDPPWYIFNQDTQQRQTIQQEALVGRFVRLQVVEKKDDPDGTLKLDLTVETDAEVYIVRSGADTYFSQSLVWLLDGIDREQLVKPLALVPKAGERTAFAKIYDPERREFLYRERPDEFADWTAIRQSAIAKVNGEVPPVAVTCLSEQQALELWAIAKAGGWTRDGAKDLLAEMGYGGLKQVLLRDRDRLLNAFADLKLRAQYCGAYVSAG